MIGFSEGYKLFVIHIKHKWEFCSQNWEEKKISQSTHKNCLVSKEVGALWNLNHLCSASLNKEITLQALHNSYADVYTECVDAHTHQHRVYTFGYTEHSQIKCWSI